MLRRDRETLSRELQQSWRYLGPLFVQDAGPGRYLQTGKLLSSSLNLKQAPFATAWERSNSSIIKLDSGSGNKIFNGTRHKHFASLCLICNADAHLSGNTSNLSVY